MAANLCFIVTTPRGSMASAAGMSLKYAGFRVSGSDLSYSLTP